MKIDDLNLTEAPASLFQQAGRRIGAKALGMLPGVTAASKAAELTGKADQGAVANQMLIDFSKWIGGKGKNVAQATRADLNAYFQSRGIKSPLATNTNTVIPKAQLDQAFRQVATAQIQQQGHPNAAVAKAAPGGTPGSTAAPASSTAPGINTPTAPAQPAAPKAASQPQGQQTARINPAKLPGATQYGNNWKVPTNDRTTFLIVDRSGRIVSLERQKISPPPPELTDEEMPKAVATPKAQPRQRRQGARPAGSPSLVQQMKQSNQ